MPLTLKLGLYLRKEDASAHPGHKPQTLLREEGLRWESDRETTPKKKKKTKTERKSPQVAFPHSALALLRCRKYNAGTTTYACFLEVSVFRHLLHFKESMTRFVFQALMWPLAEPHTCFLPATCSCNPATVCSSWLPPSLRRKTHQGFDPRRRGGTAQPHIHVAYLLSFTRPVMFDLMEIWETAEAAGLLGSSPACETQSHLETLCLSLLPRWFKLTQVFFP